MLQLRAPRSQRLVSVHFKGIKQPGLGGSGAGTVGDVMHYN